MSKHNEKQNILCQNKNGYVTFCYECNKFHVAFGTVTFDQTEDSLLSLINVLSTYHSAYEYYIPCNYRCIQIDTPYRDFRLLFSINELLSFREMLNDAYLIYKAEQMMNNEN